MTPIPLSDLTDELIRGSDLIHVTDPHDLGFQAWLPVRPAAEWGETAEGYPLVLRIAADRKESGPLLAELRARICAATSEAVS